jgi:DNA-binding transcriptional regulator LsrR (DeoR family)
METWMSRLREARQEVEAKKADLAAAYQRYYAIVAEAADEHGQAHVARELGVSRQYVNELIGKAQRGGHDTSP